jgi:hypothetical protein
MTQEEQQVTRKCAYCGKDTGNEWIKYCGYWCEVYGEKEQANKGGESE